MGKTTLPNSLYGLILAGGKSTRMGKDKGTIDYYNLPQREYMFKMAQELCDQAFYSIREIQLSEFNENSNCIIDENLYRGPFNGILSAHHKYPHVAWLVLATDLPLIKASDLLKLIQSREPNKMATAFSTKGSGLPEPLIAIWEPQGLREATAYLRMGGGSCPRKFLLQHDIKLVHPSNDAVLMNANTEEEYKLATQEIDKVKIDRYTRQTNLKDFGKEAQQKLREAKVLVIGAGGLGIPVLQYLTASGVGTLGVVENDVIDLSNLQRQVIYKEGKVGEPKINNAINFLKDLNSDVTFIPYKTYITKDNALEIISKFDLVIDASDNFPTRYLINDACVILKKPFVYGALHSFEGQISVFNYNEGPTYRCLFPEMPAPGAIPNCDENGVLGAIAGIVGTLQALEAIKTITGLGTVLNGQLLMYDGLEQAFTKMKFKKISKNLNISNLENDYGFIHCNLAENIEAGDLLEILNIKNEVSLIDVRSKKEYSQFHLESSINIPLTEIEENRVDLPMDSENTIYLICQSGQRSAIAQKILSSKYSTFSFKNVLGGLNAIIRQKEIIADSRLM